MMKAIAQGVVEMTMKFLAWVSIIGVIGMIGVLLWWHQYPYKVIEVYQPAKVLNERVVVIDDVQYPAVKRGEVLSYRMDYTKHMEISARVRRQLVNDRSICLMEGAGQAKMGKNSVIIDVFIPPNMFPGLYRLQTFYEYSVNPIRDLSYDYYTEWFVVLP